MRLIIGGMGQGKLAYAMSLREAAGGKVLEAVCLAKEEPEKWAGAGYLNHLHLLVGEVPEEEKVLGLLERFLAVSPDAALLCDEVGCGVVPAEKREREYRETVGRVCIQMAARAETVDRVMAGIGRRIKGGEECEACMADPAWRL